ncbi:DNA-binding SARP family transcriptional activator [Catenibacillus scindens]|uniref:DNA-binding SARP family transcriptional activator n=1 Tax=Catenibacillus scindens TaxID=673271 RepID=A0A7W8HBX5_9FIRM|nr:BTAD domain-containing putative transcriptional regulator [Catenibacillus scindens]MBB5264867.1 DNA-binding SARP family transcriptional activator [Catenibacillus scindens]
MSATTLHIKMFGEFSISNEYGRFSHINNKSLQITRLLAYLIANKDTEIHKDKLMELLWPDENATNPSGALRNLVYRARQILEEFFPSQEDASGSENAPVECILFSKNAYRWNPELDCEIDIFQFEDCIAQADQETDEKQQYALYQKAHDLYKGDFLNILTSDEWVVFRKVFYKNLYTKVTANMCRYLSSQKNYTAVIRLCEASSLVDPMDEQIHVEKIHAYLQMHAPSQAMAYYYSVADLFTQKFGIEPGTEMQKIYHEILIQLPNYHKNIHELENLLKEDKEEKRSFFCTFDVFKYIYQLSQRFVRRSPLKRYLVLFTLTDTSRPSEITNTLIDEMDVLYEVLSKNLRRNDVFTKAAPCQFALIIVLDDEAACQATLQRILRRYEKQRKSAQIQIQIDHSPIQ